MVIKFNHYNQHPTKSKFKRPKKKKKNTTTKQTTHSERERLQLGSLLANPRNNYVPF